VAVPCKLLEIATHMIGIVGLIWSLFAISKHIGAIISTVATFSTNAEIKEVKAHINKRIVETLRVLCARRVARYAGLLLTVKKSAINNIPMNIPKTLRSIDCKAISGGISLNRMHKMANIVAVIDRLFGSKKKVRYAIINIERVNNFADIVISSLDS